MLGIYERWSNPECIKAEFWGPDLYDEDGMLETPCGRVVTEEQLQQVETWSREWLAKKRNDSKME